MGFQSGTLKKYITKTARVKNEHLTIKNFLEKPVFSKSPGPDSTTLV
jgi:hypothetical protein